MDGFFQFLDVSPQIFNAVRVVDSSVLFYDISCSKTIFHNHDWHMITLINLIQCIAEPFRDNLPSPF